MTELVTSGSVGGMASNGCFYPEPPVTPVVGRHSLVATSRSNRAEIPADANVPRCPP